MTTVVAAILRRAGKLLICRRKPGAPHELKWEFPGGKVEPGETPEAALARELREELAIEALIGAEITRYEYTYPAKAPILLMFFEVSAFAGEPRNLVFDRIAWEEPRYLGDYDFLEGDIGFIRSRLAPENTNR